MDNLNTDNYYKEQLQQYQERKDHEHCEVCRQPLDINGECYKCFMDDLKELQRREDEGKDRR